MEASISQLETPDGKLYTVILRDVTERVRAQEELAAFAAEASGVREQEKTRIARELHDELAQSLTALKMDTLWLRENAGGDAQATQQKLTGMQAMLDSSVAAVPEPGSIALLGSGLIGLGTVGIRRYRGRVR